MYPEQSGVRVHCVALGTRPCQTRASPSLEGGYSSIEFPAAIAKGKHPVPFRTRKLSSSAPMVLRGRPRGRAGHRRSTIHKGADPSRVSPFVFFQHLCRAAPASASALRGASSRSAPLGETSSAGGCPPGAVELAARAGFARNASSCRPCSGGAGELAQNSPRSRAPLRAGGTSCPARGSHQLPRGQRPVVMFLPDVALGGGSWCWT